MIFRAQPAPGDIRVVIGDLHGDYSGLWQLAYELGIIDDDGIRQPGFWVALIGDGIHAGHGVQEADTDTLELLLDICDVMCIGNHELYFMHGIKPFAGRNQTIECQALLNRSVREGRWVAAASCDGWLLTHAGLHPGLAATHDLFAEIRGTHDPDTAWQDTERLAALLNQEFETRLMTRIENPLFDWVGHKRGGHAPYGGIFWCDWKELRAGGYPDWMPRQIVGHSPRQRVSSAAGGRLWRVDVCAALSGNVAAIVKRPGENQWSTCMVRSPHPRNDNPWATHS